tara:strand:- start:5708 stop:6277 length:570 start_codon:yes stop_codon:yes gene_type:complete
MRIISGDLKGRNILRTLNKSTRPLKDKVRESIFNLLDHSKKICFKIEKSKILDLYSGTGSFGLECLSRKASHVTFIENGYEATKILKKNIEILKLQNKIKIFLKDVKNLDNIKKEFNNKFNLIFCDPPFKENKINNILDIIYKNQIIENDGIIIIHRNKNTIESFDKHLNIIEERIYGLSRILFIKALP